MGKQERGARELAGLGRSVGVTLAMWAAMVVASLLHASWANAALPAGATQGIDSVADGRLLLRTRTPGRYVTSPRQGTHAEIHVSGPVARTIVTQRFRNPLDQWLEAVYVFPLPAGAAVDDVEILLGDRHLRGEIREKAAARREFRKAASEGQVATLVERIRPGLFRNAVANVPPRAEIVVRLSYQQTLGFDGRRWQLRFPTAVLPGAAPHPGGEAPSPAQVPAEDPRDLFSVEVLLAPGAPLAAVRSSSHRIRRRYLADERFRVDLARGNEPAGRDFVLEWETAAAESALAWSISEETDHGDYRLVAIPPFEGDRCESDLPGETIFLVDVSGSMSGAPLRAARRALADALALLPEGERIELVAFDHEFHRWRPQAGSIALADNVRAEALQWIESLEARGGTEILGALEKVLSVPARGSGHARVVLLTDGGASYHPAALRRFTDALGERRLFVIGLGPAPEGWLLERLATLGRGRLQLVSDPAELPRAVERSVGNGAAPLLRDLELVVPPGAEVEAWPDVLPDLFAGETVFLSVRTTAPETPWHVRGWCGGEVRDLVLQEGGPGEGVARAFGAARVRSLESLHDEIGLAPEDRAFLREEIVTTALRHGILSRFTSLVAVDERPLRPADAVMRSLSRMPPLPEAWRVPVAFREGWIEGAPWTLATPAELVASRHFPAVPEEAVNLAVPTGLATRRQAWLAALLLVVAALLVRAGSPPRLGGPGKVA